MYTYKKGLVKMQGEKITLQNIKGIGDKISEKILNSVGGEEELQKIVDNVDVEKIANIEGISQRKAIEIMKQLLNMPTYEFIKSDRAMELYEVQKHHSLKNILVLAKFLSTQEER